MYVCMYVGLNTCGHGGGWGRNHDATCVTSSILNVTLSQKKYAMLCLFVVFAYKCAVCMFVCVCVCVCVCVETCDLSSIFKMSFKP